MWQLYTCIQYVSITVLSSNMLQHIKQSHPSIPAERRAELVKQQPRIDKCDVQKVRIRPPRGQPTILQYMQSHEDESTPLSYLDPDLQVNSTPTRAG